MISIILPVFNAEKYINECLESIIKQTYLNWELIIVNDGSTDNTKSICDVYAHKVKRIKVFHKSNGGVSSARNLGLQHAEGEYVTFIDSDDWVEPNLLERYLDAMTQTKADWVRCGYVRESLDSQKNVTVDTFVTLSDSIEIEQLLESKRLYGFLWNSFYKRDLLKDLWFDESLSWCEDHIFSYEYLLRCKTVAIMPDCLYHYRIIESDSLSSKVEPVSWTKAIVKQTRLKVQLMKGDKEKIKYQWDGCAGFISSMIFLLYEHCSYKERMEYRSKYIDLNLHCPSFFGRLFFSRLPFPIIDRIINLRLTLRNYHYEI